MTWIPLLGAGIGAAAGLIGGESQNAASARQAQLNRDFQERMSSTAWQRGVKDMRAAGINPMLSFSQGPASSPSGSMAPVPANLGSSALSGAEGAVDAVNSARMARLQQVGQAMDNINKGLQGSVFQAQEFKTRMEGRQIAQDAGLELAARDSLYWTRKLQQTASAGLMDASASAARANAATLKALLPVAQFQGRNPRMSFLLGGGAVPKLFGSAAGAAAAMY